MPRLIRVSHRTHGRFLLLAVALALLGAGCTRRAAPPTAPPPGGVYRSDDGGITFVQQVSLTTGGSLVRTQPREVAVTPADPNTFVMATSVGLFRTDDGADTWRRLPLSAREFLSVSIHPRNPQILLASGTTVSAQPRGVIFKSLTGGESWSIVFTAPSVVQQRGGILRRRVTAATTITTIAHDPHSPEVIVAGTNTGTVLVSTDGGVHWTTRTAFTQPLTSVKFSPFVPGHLVIRVADGRLLRSTDAGASFKETRIATDTSPNLGLGEQSERVFSLLFIRHPSGIGQRLLAGTDRGLFQSDDAGETWTVVPVPPAGTARVPIASLARAADGTLWAVSGFVLYSSTDQGATWRTSDIRLDAAIRFVIADPSNPRRLYLFFD